MGESDVSVANIRNIGVLIMWQRISAMMTRLLLHRGTQLQANSMQEDIVRERICVAHRKDHSAS